MVDFIVFFGVDYIILVIGLMLCWFNLGDDIKVIDVIDVLFNCNVLGSKIVIIGGGLMGCELVFVMREVDVEVIIIEVEVNIFIYNVLLCVVNEDMLCCLVLFCGIMVMVDVKVLYIMLKGLMIEVNGYE